MDNARHPYNMITLSFTYSDLFCIIFLNNIAIYIYRFITVKERYGSESALIEFFRCCVLRGLSRSTFLFN